MLLKLSFLPGRLLKRVWIAYGVEVGRDVRIGVFRVSRVIAENLQKAIYM